LLPLQRWRKQCRWPPAASRRWSSWWWIRKSCNTEITRKPVNPLTPELHPSVQSCLPRIFTGDFNFKGLTARRLYKSFGVKGLKCSAFILFTDGNVEINSRQAMHAGEAVIFWFVCGRYPLWFWDQTRIWWGVLLFSSVLPVNAWIGSQNRPQPLSVTSWSHYSPIIQTFEVTDRIVKKTKQKKNKEDKENVFILSAMLNMSKIASRGSDTVRFGRGASVSEVYALNIDTLDMTCVLRIYCTYKYVIIINVPPL
jgi:hypothetical protein